MYLERSHHTLKKRAKVHRTKDAERVRGMVNYADKFDAKVFAMETNNDIEYSTQYKQSLDGIDSTSNNASTEEREEKVSFAIVSKRERTYIHEEVFGLFFRMRPTCGPHSTFWAFE